MVGVRPSGYHKNNNNNNKKQTKPFNIAIFLDAINAINTIYWLIFETESEISANLILTSSNYGSRTLKYDHYYYFFLNSIAQKR